MKQLTGYRILEAVLVGIGLTCFVLIMILMVLHYHKQDAELIARADYLIERSEASIERWNHGK